MAISVTLLYKSSSAFHFQSLALKDFNFLLNNKIDISNKSINYEYCCGVKKTILADKSELYSISTYG